MRVLIRERRTNRCTGGGSRRPSTSSDFAPASNHSLQNERTFSRNHHADSVPAYDQVGWVTVPNMSSHDLLGDNGPNHVRVSEATQKSTRPLRRIECPTNGL